MIGPLTNLALALAADPSIVDGIGTLTIMGGNVYGRGNTTPAAEFNIYADPEAAHVVLTAGIETVVIPWSRASPTSWKARGLDALSAGHPAASLHRLLDEALAEACPRERWSAVACPIASSMSTRLRPPWCSILDGHQVDRGIVERGARPWDHPRHDAGRSRRGASAPPRLRSSRRSTSRRSTRSTPYPPPIPPSTRTNANRSAHVSDLDFGQGRSRYI